MNYINRTSSTVYFAEQRANEIASESCDTIDPLNLLIDYEDSVEDTYLLASELIPISKDML